MQPSSRRERTLWTLAGLLVLTIYATLYWARFLAEYLRQQGLLIAALGIAFGAVGLGIILYLLRRRPGWRQLGTLAAAAAAYAAVLIPAVGRPEEALHFLEYGLLAALIYGALAERRRRLLETTGLPGRLARFPGWTAFFLTTAAGWADEGIQKILPNRFYDLRDVGFNAAAAALAVATSSALVWARKREAMPTSEPPGLP